MANILRFPKRSGPKQEHEFLQDDNDILRFDAVNQQSDHAFSPPEEPRFLEARRMRSKDWSNQELADLFRVKRLLDAAGVPNEIDRGITDEGDPWFLFCNADGDVFIHLCRLDGIYVLDSPNIETPLRGYDFNGLIEQFTDRRLPGSSERPGATDQRVVRLERNGTVFLHPSTMLTALIWTLFLASEELVMILPDDTSATLDLVDDPDTTATSPDQTDMFDAGPVLTDPDEQGARGEPGPARNPADQHFRDLTASSEAKLGQNSYAIGLSAIAISLGFMSEVPASDIENMTLDNILALLAEQNGGEEQLDSGLERLGLDQGNAQDFLASLTEFFDTISVAVDEPEKSGTSNPDEHVHASLLKHIENLLQDLENQLAAFSDGTQQPEAPRSAPETIDVTNAASNDQNPDEVEQGILISEAMGTAQGTDQMSQMLSKFGFLNTTWAPAASVREYTIENDTVLATFDVNARELEKADVVISNSRESENLNEEFVNTNPTGSSENRDFNAYDDDAYEFISYLASKNDELEMVATSSELILLDPEVFEMDAGEAFIMSWTLDNRDVISVIGLRSDYEFYDLIA